MTTCIIVFVIAFVASVVVTPLVRKIAYKVKALDYPNQKRKIHTKPIPRLGGLVIYFAFLAPFVAFLFYKNAVTQVTFDNILQLIALLIGGTLILIVGIIDDIKGLKPKVKILLQLIATIPIFTFGFYINAIHIPLGGILYLGIFAIPFTVFWILGSTNAFNFIDGVDGLASGIAFFVSATLFILALTAGNVVNAVRLASIAGATLGFLIFNFHPASIFLGDSGSLFLGYMIGTIAIFGSKSHAIVTILIPILVMGVPIVDTLMAILRRWTKKLPVSVADKEHIHHKLLANGFSQRKVVLIIYAVCILLGGSAFVITFTRSEISAIILVSLGIFMALVAKLSGCVDFSKLKDRLTEKINRRRTISNNRVFILKAEEELENTTSLESIWDVYTDVLNQIQADWATLLLYEETDGTKRLAKHLTWRRNGEIKAGNFKNCLSYTITIPKMDGFSGKIVVKKEIGKNPIPIETLELLDDFKGKVLPKIIETQSDPLPIHRILYLNRELIRGLIKDYGGQ